MEASRARAFGDAVRSAARVLPAVAARVAPLVLPSFRQLPRERHVLLGQKKLRAQLRVEVDGLGMQFSRK